MDKIVAFKSVGNNAVHLITVKVSNNVSIHRDNNASAGMSQIKIDDVIGVRPVDDQHFLTWILRVIFQSNESPSRIVIGDGEHSCRLIAEHCIAARTGQREIDCFTRLNGPV